MLLAVSLLLLLAQGATATRPGVVIGQLQTREGAPAAAIRISAVVAPPPNIRPSDGQNYYSSQLPASTALTDAQGRYRLTNLAPGRYFIIASTFGYSTFYPTTTNPDNATVVVVGADAPAAGIDFSVILPPGGRVSGRINPPLANVREKAVLSGVELGELLEAPLNPDGTFTFGHLPKGSYVVSIFPTPPGMPSRVFRVAETDTQLDLVRPTLRTVTGRLVVPQGPLPYTMLGFETDKSYVTAPISPDGTFRTQLQPAQHAIVLAGMPAGYSLGSVRLGTQDLKQSVTVGSGDLTGLVVTIATPAKLPRLRGKIVGVAPASLTNARVQLTGRIISTLDAPVQPDGSFEFPAVTPGTYRVTVPQVPSITPSYAVVGLSDSEIQIGK